MQTKIQFELDLINPTFLRSMQTLSFPNSYQLDYTYTASIAFPNDQISRILYVIRHKLSGIQFR